MPGVTDTINDGTYNVLSSDPDSYSSDQGQY